jgi:hypothetical protein
MDFVLVDYSEVYYRVITKTAMPEKRSGKFVQIKNYETDREYLVLSPKGLSTYHANIVERFCLLNNKIKGSYNEKRDYFEIHDPEWYVIGGGMWMLDETNKVLELSGTSRGYGKFDPNGLKEKILSLENMSDYTVLIDGL